MAKSNALKMKLPAVDDLFSTEEQRQEAKLAKIYDIPLSEIDDFPDHPYRVLDDEDMDTLVDSIDERGIITPATVHKKDDGRYEIISGHRRKHACERLGLETLRCEVVEVTRDEAIILMVDSNAQRSEIAPTDKGKAYKMKLDFCGMEVKGKNYAEKKDAGEAIIAACKAMTKPEAQELGSYRGFGMELNFDPCSREYTITLKGKLRHTTALGTDIFGNIQRLDNLLDKMSEKKDKCVEQLGDIQTQLANAKVEVEKPFPHEEELKTKTERLAELNSLLDMDKKENEIVDGEREDDDDREQERSDSRDAR